MRAMHDLRAQLRGCADALEQQQRATALARLHAETAARERDAAQVRSTTLHDTGIFGRSISHCITQITCVTSITTALQTCLLCPT